MSCKQHIVEVDVTEVEKRYRPSKHYVYCIWVTWNDGKRQLIFRRYSQFFELQCQLLDRFETEAGSKNPSDRILPFLPGKIIFKRSHVRSVAMDRLNPINIYCKKLIKLKKEISRCNLVIRFFELTNDDIVQSTSRDSLKKKEDQSVGSIGMISQPIKSDDYVVAFDYKGLSKTELSLRKNTRVYVIEKNLSGWWFVDAGSEGQGFVPHCVLKPLNSQSEPNESYIYADTPETYVVKKDYSARRGDEVSVCKGDYVQVIAKSMNGWWKIKINDRVGLAPAVYLEKFITNSSMNRFLTDTDTYSLPPREYVQHDQISNRESFITPTSSSTSFAMDMDTVSNYSGFQDQQIEPEIWYAMEDYIDTVGDGVSLKRGQMVYVLSKECSNGWWYVKFSDEEIEGWAPSSFLQAQKPKPPRPPRPVITEQIAHLINKEPVHEENEQEYKPIKVSEMRKKFE